MPRENGNRKDAIVGAKRLGLYRSLCAFAADRARRPPFRALSVPTEMCGNAPPRKPGFQASKLPNLLVQESGVRESAVSGKAVVQSVNQRGAPLEPPCLGGQFSLVTLLQTLLSTRRMYDWKFGGTNV